MSHGIRNYNVLPYAFLIQLHTLNFAPLAGQFVRCLPFPRASRPGFRSNPGAWVYYITSWRSLLLRWFRSES